MHLLVVEDDAHLASVLKRGLEEHGYVVDLVRDGEDGLAYAEAGPYDLLVLDIMLPRLSGLEITRRLRAQRNTVPVLLLTARDAVDDRVEGLDSGADDYLTKPFAFRELLARVRALLRREAGSKEAILRVGDLEVNPATREVRRGSRQVELTTKEYAILEYMVRNANHVLSRTQIAEHAWEYDFSALSNVVDVYIGYLRRKIDDDFEPKLIHTVRGVGYRLKVPDS